MRFTLIELMVVVSVIAILTALLLPALGKARGQAMSSSCANNLKQTGMAQSMYSDDYQEWIVPCCSPEKYFAFELLAGLSRNGTKLMTSNYGVKYLGKTRTEGTFVCPGEAVGFGASADGLFEFTHYCVNAYVTGYTTYYPFHKWAAISQPSVAIFAGDNERTTEPNLDFLTRLAFRHGGINPLNNNSVYGTGAANLVYMDGHVEGRRVNDLLNVSGYISSTEALKAGVRN